MSLPVSVRGAAGALVVATALLGSVGAQAASAVTVRVDDDKAECPHAKFRRISRALAAVPPGSIVVACPGTYVETLRIDKPGVRVMGLRGRHADIVLTQGPGGDPSIPMVEMSAPDTTLAAVKIRDSRPTPDTGCFSFGVLVDNGPGPFAGASLIDNVTVRQLASEEFFECTFEGTGIGVGAASRAGRATVRNSTVVADTTGVEVTEDGSNASITGNVLTVRPGRISNGLGVDVEGGTARIVRNDVSRFNVGVGTFTSSGRPLVYRNTIHDNSNVGLVLGFRTSQETATATAINNDIHGNEHGMRVFNQGSLVAGNRIHDNGGFGIQVDAPGSGNEFVANVAVANALEGCSDSTTGDGTAGTANTWIDNISATSSPRGVCLPPPVP